MDPDPAEIDGRPSTRHLAARVSPELHRAVRVRCADLDMTVMDFVTASLEMVLKAEIDPRIC